MKTSINMISMVGLALMATTALADDSNLPGEFSGNVAITTDYVFRGYTQANENVALQGGLDWDSGAGFYLGAWGSNVNFGDGDEASVELDLYGGYAGEIDAFSYDVGFLYYLYPGADSALNYDFWEVYGSIGYDFGAASVSAGLAYTPENFGNTDDGYYYSAGVSVPVGDSFSVDANIGYYDVDPSFGADYTDWNVGATYSFEWFDADIRYFDTDVTACANVCDSRVVFTVSRSF